MSGICPNFRFKPPVFAVSLPHHGMADAGGDHGQNVTMLGWSPPHGGEYNCPRLRDNGDHITGPEAGQSDGMPLFSSGIISALV